MITDRLSLGPSNMKVSEARKPNQDLSDLTSSVDSEDTKAGNDSFRQVMKSKTDVEPDRKTDSKPTAVNSKPQSNNDDAVREKPGDLKVERQADGKAPERTTDQTRVQRLEGAREESPPVPQAVNGPKQKAMLKFMDSMESELGVPPERIVEAMATLPASEAVKSPEYTVSQVIEKLDLDPQDEQRAEELYMSLLTNLSQLDQNQTQLSKPLAVGASVSAAPVFLSSQERKMQLNQSIDQMNQRFFNVGQSKAGMSSPTMNSAMTQRPEMAILAEDVYSPSPALMNQNLSPLEVNSGYSQDLVKAGNQALPASKNEAATMAYAKRSVDPNLNQANALALQANAAAQPQEDAEYAGLLQKLAALGIAAEGVNQGVQKSQMNQQQMAQSNFENVAAPTAAAAFMVQDQKVFGASSGNRNQQGGFGHESSKSFEGSSPSATVDASSVSSFFSVSPFDPSASAPQMSNGLHSVPSQLNALGGAGAANAASGAVNQNQTDPNIQTILNQAQYVLRKGGGEARVKLYPEGLGELNLKVMVQDGKVNLEMSTETKEAKKAIESSLSDLKSSLSLHKLSVDSIKVDVGNNSSQADSNNAQKQPETKFDLNREQARQFLGQFRDENMQNRGAFYEMPGLKAYNQRKGPEPLKPADEVQSSSRRYAAAGKGRELNLVA